MSIWGKLAGAAAGLAIGGPIGALLGGLAGHFGLDRDRQGTGQQKDIAFTVGVIALSAKMAKADGVVTESEIDAFKEVFKIPPGEAANVARVFNLAKQDIAGFEAYADQLGNLFKDNRRLLQDVLEGLFYIAASDEVLHPKEDDYLKTVARRFGFSDSEFTHIRARFLPNDQTSPYDVLGVTPEIADDALKSHYRKLVAENHPDKLIARGVPEEFVQVANRKLASINDAYRTIAKERGI
ncbi:MAG: TerB family tellurite resistance protein [Hyphomicrobiaceae bacterium]|nr:TerB family tellurite resistance protein [Hyphomicrobiaceae bacterium]